MYVQQYDYNWWQLCYSTVLKFVNSLSVACQAMPTTTFEDASM